jgi:hypothetical protein
LFEFVTVLGRTIGYVHCEGRGYLNQVLQLSFRARVPFAVDKQYALDVGRYLLEQFEAFANQR